MALPLCVCLQGLAHSERHPVTGVPAAKVIHNFGRADTVDRAALARLVGSISRFLEPEQAITAAHTGEVEVLDSRRFGGAWVLGRLWDRLGIGAALRGVAEGRRLDGAGRARSARTAQVPRLHHHHHHHHQRRHDDRLTNPPVTPIV